MQPNKSINTRLERDARYVAEKSRLDTLKAQLHEAEAARLEMQGRLAHGDAPVNTVEREAQALLSGVEADAVASKEQQALDLEKLAHKIAVLRQAVLMQGHALDKTRAEVSRAICADLAPKHAANVRAVVSASLLLAEALRAERELRENLQQNGVFYSSDLRAMTIPGFDLMDTNSRLSRYLLECAAYGFIKPADLPESVRRLVPPPAKPETRTERVQSDGWINA